MILVFVYDALYMYLVFYQNFCHISRFVYISGENLTTL